MKTEEQNEEELEKLRNLIYEFEGYYLLLGRYISRLSPRTTENYVWGDQDNLTYHSYHSNLLQNLKEMEFHFQSLCETTEEISSHLKTWLEEEENENER